MKQLITISLLLLGTTVFSQQKNVKEQKAVETTAPVNARTTAGSTQTETTPLAPLQFDVNDKFMGRAAEFLGNLTVAKLPEDFPVYEKQWDLKEYNQVVLAFYYNHMDIVKEPVRKKLELLQH